jgi:hypothetical protein
MKQGFLIKDRQESDGPKTVVAPSVVVLRTRRGPELSTLTDVRREMSRVYRQCRAGKIRTEDGSRYIYMLSQVGKMLELIEIDTRLEALERALGRRLP